MTLREKVKSKRETILELALQCGIRNVRLFGSLVRSGDHPTHDVDLLVRLVPHRGLLDLIAFKQDVEDLLNLQVDVVEDEGLRPYLRETILAEARPL